MRSSFVDKLPPRRGIQAGLLSRPVVPEVAVDPNRAVLASLLAGRLCGEGVLPAHLGLLEEEWASLWNGYFPGPPLILPDQHVEDIPERQDLMDVLCAYRAGRFVSEIWLARIVAQACVGRDHLWHDLGLMNREELSFLLLNAFPALARQNVHDMKWKKFLYRLYCARDGIYFCPAPSCGECVDYARCFAPET
jgi:nitrogen fixation protein NifQ